MSEKLLPCPFCGGEAQFVPAPTDEENETLVLGPAMVNCTRCDAHMLGQFDEESIEGWNRRAPEGRELLEIVRDIVSDCKGVVNPGFYKLASEALAKAEGR